MRLDVLLAANACAVRARAGRWLIHQLRNPAQALSLVSGIADEGPEVAGVLADTAREAAGQIAQSVVLLERLLAVPRPSAQSAPVSVLDSLRFVAALYGLSHNRVTLDCSHAGSAQLPAVLAIDYELELLLLNLLLNSLEALRDRPDGRIVVRTAHENATVQVCVEDDGPGIPKHLESHLFEPFVSGWSTGTSAGLGLAVSRGIAERDGGSLTCVPAARPGACFLLTLPAVG